MICIVNTVIVNGIVRCMDLLYVRSAKDHKEYMMRRTTMTERFTEEYNEDDGIYLLDNQTGEKYWINPVRIIDLLNALHEENQRYRYIINKQERTLADHINSKYKCALCGLVGFIGKQFTKELKK